MLLLLVAACGSGEQAPVPQRGAESSGTQPRAMLTINRSLQPSRLPPESLWVGYRTWIVTEEGIGPVRAGMTFAEANTALGGRFEAPDTADAECDYAGIVGAEEVSFLVSEGRIAAVSVRDTLVATSLGARVGDAETRVRALYPTASIRPHEYADGNYLTIMPRAPRDTLSAIRFETNRGRVTDIHAGRRPHVLYIEGCS